MFVMKLVLKEAEDSDITDEVFDIYNKDSIKNCESTLHGEQQELDYQNITTS